MDSRLDDTPFNVKNITLLLTKTAQRLISSSLLLSLQISYSSLPVQPDPQPFPRTIPFTRAQTWPWPSLFLSWQTRNIPLLLVEATFCPLPLAQSLNCLALRTNPHLQRRIPPTFLWSSPCPSFSSGKPFLDRWLEVSWAQVADGGQGIIQGNNITNTLFNIFQKMRSNWFISLWDSVQAGNTVFLFLARIDFRKVQLAGYFLLIGQQNLNQTGCWIINISVKMETLLNSRMSRDETSSKLEHLSPEKFGKAAYACLSFTPSKLVDNVLYKEVITLKKIEEESSKVRSSDALNSILKDRLAQVIEERDGIEATLTQQIVMYKKMLAEKDAKHEQRIKDVQQTFNVEIQKLILSKEEEAKYAQSEKELLEGRIEELEEELAHLKDRLDHGGSNFDDLTRTHQKLQIHYKNVCQKLEQIEKKLKEQGDKGKADYEELSRKFYNSEVDFKGKIDKFELEREREKENLDRIHRNQLEKVENKRSQEATLKNQELRELASTFQSEANRLKDIINTKEGNIGNLNKSLNDEKEKVLDLTRQYTAELTNLVHQKNRFKEEIDTLNMNISLIKDDAETAQTNSGLTSSSLEGTIAELKEELEFNQINFIREKDRNAFVVGDLHRELTCLTAENDRASLASSENGMLCKEIRGLKDLLLESSMEMERCKDEFLRIGREKDHLTVKVRELGYENENLHRIKIEKEQEAKGWKDSYYMSRR